jgi:hypothetical protein
VEAIAAPVRDRSELETVIAAQVFGVANLACDLGDKDRQEIRDWVPLSQE